MPFCGLAREPTPSLAPGVNPTLIRAQCDKSLKYYRWALRRMPSIQEQAGQRLRLAARGLLRWCLVEDRLQLLVGLWSGRPAYTRSLIELLVRVQVTPSPGPSSSGGG